jgi:hypothetical protein
MDHPDYVAADNAFNNRTIFEASLPELQRYLCAISCNVTGDDAVYARDIMRTTALNHLILQMHISTLNRSNLKTQRWFMGLAVCSMIAAVIQIFA